METKREEILDVLKSVGIFSSLTVEELQTLAQHVSIEDLKLGKVIVSEGETRPLFLILHKGAVRLKKKVRGRVTSIGKIKQGAIEGAGQFLKTSPWEYTLATSSKSVILTIDPTIPELAAIRQKLQEPVTVYEFSLLLQRIIETDKYDRNWFNQFMNDCRLFEAEPGTSIFTTDSLDNSLYLMLDGKVELYGDHIDGEVLLGAVYKNDYFGEYGALSGAKQLTIARVREHASILEIPTAHVKQILGLNPGLSELLQNRMKEYEQEDTRKRNQSQDTPEETAPEEIKKIGVRHFPWLRQHDETDCGAACLTMISKFYGLRLSMGKVREMANVSTAGASMAAVCRAAENLGYRSRGIKATLQGLQQLQFPMIVHWQGFHYIVLYRMDAKHVWVADPAIGIRKMTHAFFKENWTGYAIEVEPTEALHEIEPAKNPIFRFLRYILPYKWYFLEILIAAFVLNILGLASPLFVQSIVDNVIVYKDVSLLNMMLGGMVLVAFFSTFMSAVQQLLAAHITARIDLKMLAEFYKHVLSLPMSFFYKRKIGDVITRFGENGKIRDILVGAIVSTILNFFMLVIYLNMMFAYNVELSLIVLAFVPFFVGQTLILTPIFKRISNEIFVVNADQSSMMIESIQGIEAIKASTIEWNIRTKWESRFLEMVNKSFRLSKLQMLSGIISQVVNTASTVLILWYGARQVIDGSLSVGELMAFNSIIGSVMGPLMGFVSLWDSFQTVRTSMDRVNDVLEVKPEETPLVTQKQQRNYLSELRGDISIVDLSFRYGDEDSPLILNKLNLEVQAGQQVALVGKSGCGKSTLTKLLGGFIKPTSGSILIDGKDIMTIDLHSLRQNIGWVLQDSFLFNATVAENIALGMTNPRMEDLVRAAEMAAAHEFIVTFPHGYKTRIGEQGMQVSGGQRQRICIARALFYNPKILIFDEATSALDAKSEKRIQDSMNSILKGRTAFIIAHRLSTVRDCDFICYLGDGVVLEKGTHAELMAKKGLYWEMASQQIGGE